MAKSKREHPSQVPEIKKGIRILWHCAYYDGVLTGFAKYKGKPHYFALKKDYHSKYMGRKVGRTFWLYKLTDEQWKVAEHWHNEFRVHVGSHCDYKWDRKRKSYREAGNSSGASMSYWKEMYYEPVAAYEKEHGSIEQNLDRYNQVVGYATWDVIYGKTWTEWRRPKKKVEDVVG